MVGNSAEGRSGGGRATVIELPDGEQKGACTFRTELLFTKDVDCPLLTIVDTPASAGEYSSIGGGTNGKFLTK